MRLHKILPLCLGIICSGWMMSWAESALESQRGTVRVSDEVLVQAASLRDRALMSSDAYSIVADLTVSVGARYPGTPGDKAAVAWAERWMNEAGFDRVVREPVNLPGWSRGETRVALVAPLHHELVVTALGYSGGTGAESVTATVVRFAHLDDLVAAPAAEVRGRVVFIDQMMPVDRTIQAYFQALPGRMSGPGLAAAKGAAAYLVRSLGTSEHRFAHTGMTAFEVGQVGIPALALSVPDANLLAALMARGEVPTLTLKADHRFEPAVTTHNVIGEITGSHYPDKRILLAAHLDSWDLGMGALDDGAGVAIMLEVARWLRQLPTPPKVTIQVVLFGAEEVGYHGAKAFAAAHPDWVEDYLMLGESDGGDGRIWRFDTRFATADLDKAETIAGLLAPLGIARGYNQARGGPDTRFVAGAQAPLVTLYQDMTRYFHYHHTPDDTLEKVQPESLRQNVAAWLTLAYILSESYEPASP